MLIQHLMANLTGLIYYYPSNAFFSLYVFQRNSPNKVFAQANHLRLNFVASSL